VQALNAFRPSILYAYPSAAEFLARLCIQENLRFEVSLVVTSSEMFLPTARTLVSEAFCARTVDYYGQAERVAFAYSVDGGEYRFLGSYGVVELDGDDQHSIDPTYEVLGTNLHNFGQVLLRYRTGDSIQLNRGQTDLKAVCLGIDSFPRLEGRLDDALVGSEGRRYVGINHIPRSLEQYGRFQFVQARPNHVLIQVEGAAPEVVGKPAPVMERARLKLPPDFEVEIAFVDQLTRTAAGKTPFVLRAV
jgi:phenylacetate-CoA ligase